MNKRIEDKLKLLRIVHRVEEAWITEDDVYTEEPKNFTGVYYAWYKNGQLEYRWNYKDGERHNLSCGWYKNGQLEYEYNTKGGKCHGLCRSWFGNGQLECEYNNKDGEYHGLCRSWYDNGQLKYRKNWKDGELIKSP